MQNTELAKKNEQGFTLIELSIVLVIIGLIVGGILVGQDLIKAAEIRATVGQIEKYNAAVNTFRTKYNAIPGDISGSAGGNAAAFGLFFETTLGGTAGHMDQNGLIEGGSAAGTVGLGETLDFWRHMSDANLIDGAFGSTGNSAIVATSGAVTGTVTTLNQSLPPAKVGRGNSFIVYSSSGLNYYQLMPIASIPASGVYTYGAAGLTPIEAYNMDIKLDDGLPNTGVVQAKDTGGVNAVNGAASWAAAATAAKCLSGGASGTDTADLYNRVTGSGGTDPSCSVRFRFN